MDSAETSESQYTTTPLKSEGNSFIVRHQLLSKSSNPYKTPVQNRYNSATEFKVSKTKSYRSVIIEKMPIYSPPSKSISFIRNPFEHARLLKERLSQPLCSPSLFKAVSSPAQNDDFTWNIEDISMLHPANIDENPSQDFDSWFSPATESQAQEAINKFFSSRVVNMESPMQPEVKKKPVQHSTKDKPLTLEMWTQTDMTLPPTLPPDLEALLSRYCIFGNSYRESTETELNTSNGSRKKLLFRNFNYVSPERKVERNFSPQARTTLSSPELSPISESTPMDISVKNNSSVRLSLAKDIAMCEKENMFSQEWNIQESSTPRAMTNSNDSAFSSM